MLIVASAKEARLAVNDLRTFYSKKVRSLEDQAREAQARATAAEKKLRESREKWASTKAKQTARLTYLERQAAQRDGKPGEMDRLRAELQVWTARFLPSFWRAFPKLTLLCGAGGAGACRLVPAADGVLRAVSAGRAARRGGTAQAGAAARAAESHRRIGKPTAEPLD